jgi:hypothetical protein
MRTHRFPLPVLTEPRRVVVRALAMANATTPAKYFANGRGSLLDIGNPKLAKSRNVGVMAFGLHLAPADLSGCNTCPMASAGCRAACLNEAGQGMNLPSVQLARIMRTRWFFTDRKAFMVRLVSDIERAIRKAHRDGYRPAFRLNATSDLRWETVKCKRNGREYRNVMKAFPDVMFYDYTKLENRRGLPSNYHLTFSRSEENHDVVADMLRRGFNVAVVFDTPKGQPLPAEYLGFPVLDGRTHDARFLDAPDHIVGLSALGHGVNDCSGFVVSTVEA